MIHLGRYAVRVKMMDLGRVKEIAVGVLSANPGEDPFAGLACVDPSMQAARFEALAEELLLADYTPRHGDLSVQNLLIADSTPPISYLIDSSTGAESSSHWQPAIHEGGSSAPGKSTFIQWILHQTRGNRRLRRAATELSWLRSGAVHVFDDVVALLHPSTPPRQGTLSIAEFAEAMARAARGPLAMLLAVARHFLARLARSTWTVDPCPEPPEPPGRIVTSSRRPVRGPSSTALPSPHWPGSLRTAS